jgi:hypothetical protein
MLISLLTTSLTTIFSSRALPHLRSKGGVTSRGKQDDKGDPRYSTKTHLKARGPRYGPVLHTEGSSDFHDSHLWCEYECTDPYKKTSEPASETSSPPVINKKVHRKKLASKD